MHMALSFSPFSAPRGQARLTRALAFRPTFIVSYTRLAWSASHSRLTSGRFGEQSCVPCEGEGGPQALTLSQAEEHLASLQSGWEIEHDEQKRLYLSRIWKTKNFLAALELSRRFGEVAEREGHHPDVHITGWNRLKLVLWTHSLNGLTLNDFILAAKLEDVDMQGLLWRKKKVENI
jgi:4a-hydroxytetrahydrobiopterin dehydratase